jgi:hypothetical protein
VTYELNLFVLFQLLTRLEDRIVAQAVSCRPVSLAARVRARDTPFWLGFVVEKMVLALRFCLVSIIPSVPQT